MATRAYLTLAAGGPHTGTDLGTLRLLLRPDVVPRTVTNFTTLLSRPSPRGYRGCPFHRLIRGFMIQGGDFTNGDGTGGASIYGGKEFEDENFGLGHDGRGVLSMANSGPNTNGSQFFISFRATPHLDGKHVVFGTVDMGDKESVAVLDKLESMRTDGDDRPLVEVRISDCGVIEEKVDRSGEATTGAAAEGDDDEIDLDDDDEDGEGPRKPQEKDGGGGPNPAEDDEDEIDIDEDEVDNPAPAPAVDPTASKKVSKKAALRARLRSLKTRMNQSRALNRREVRSEGERLGSEEGMKREKRRLKKEERERRSKEWEEMNGRALGSAAANGGGRGGAALKDGEEKYMAESADASLRRAARKAEKARTNRFEANDYYNPEGQHRNYERGLKSISASSTAAAEASASSSTYDPLNLDHPTESALATERAGARRLASELRRRHEKATNRKRDREVEFDAADVSGINQRNKRFNEKIGRNFDKHTAEIRQNLERGTAL